ncbi:MAG: family 1 encapsulin nanocompartment shell protein [Candidatus Dormibacteraceae bacterium]
MSHLLRSHAPITRVGWKLLDQEAAERLTPGLAARRLIDFQGPQGWEFSATNLGRTEVIKGGNGSNLEARRRCVLPLVEVRANFKVGREELSDVARGAVDIDLDELDRAAREMVIAENRAVFHGWPEAGIQGITELSPHPRLELTEEEDYLERISQAVGLLLSSGISGPYGMALGPEEYVRVAQAEQSGYPLLRHLQRILEGSVVWALGVRGGIVMSLRGGDFSLESGQDLSVGYSYHDARSVHLYIEQSFSFQVLTPEAAVSLSPILPGDGSK